MVVLGTDAISQLSAGNFRLDLDRMWVTINREVLPLIDSLITTLPTAHEIRGSATRVIGPRCVAIFDVQETPDISHHGPLVFTPKLSFRKINPLLIPCLLLTASNVLTQIPVMNTTNCPVTIYKDTVLGILQPASRLDSQQSFSNFSSTIEVKLQNLQPEYKEPIRKLLSNNKAIFQHPEDHPSTTKLITHKIDTGNNQPIKQRPYRVPYAQRQFISDEVEKMLKHDLIRPSNSSWSSPVVLAKKKDGSYRFCVELNTATFKDVYPIPRAEEIFDQLGASKIFSTLDLDRGFWQIPMKENDKSKTAFTTFTGLFEFNVMPFGLCNAPATFQRLMERVLHDLSWKNVFIYMDDILIASTDINQHVIDLQNVFNRLRQANLKLNFKKNVVLLNRMSPT